eukprot:1770065-Prymnesium_polylepis.1
MCIRDRCTPPRGAVRRRLAGPPRAACRVCVRRAGSRQPRTRGARSPRNGAVHARPLHGEAAARSGDGEADDQGDAQRVDVLREAGDAAKRYSRSARSDGLEDRPLAGGAASHG